MIVKSAQDQEEVQHLPEFPPDAEGEGLKGSEEDGVEPPNPQNMMPIGRTEEGEAEPPNPHVNRMKYYVTCI